MVDDRLAPSQQESRLARRLSRLFRAERMGRVERWPDEIGAQLRSRRARLIDEMLRLDAQRRAVAPLGPPELARAMAALAEEIGCSEQRCLDRLAELGAELHRRRGAATGLRGGGGQVLGRG